MKKIIALSAMASAILFAGGNVAPVEEPSAPIVAPIVEAENDSGFYVGFGYGLGQATEEPSVTLTGGSLGYTEDYNYNSIMLLSGYKVNQYVAVEARYWMGLTETVNFNNGVSTFPFEASPKTFAFYLKPMYPVTKSINAYGLLGYANSDLGYSSSTYRITPTSDSDGFSWGLGADYQVTEKYAVYLDYVSMYNETTAQMGVDFKETLSTWNLGISYAF